MLIASNQSDQKFKELLLYVAEKTQFDEKCGATKLNKILFFCDFLAYRELGKAITSKTYQKLPNGPAPKAMLPVRKELQKSGELEVYERDYYGRSQIRVRPRRKANLDIFSGSEVALIDSVLNELKDDDGSDVSHRSHKYIFCWDGMPVKETIPYQLALIDPKPTPTEGDVRFAQSLPSLPRY